ncbi:MAG: 4-hydroxy-tetrahydrodipicolinate reductase [Gammaproteobacteria bacterium RIFCSPHIGHO2_12_FULL_41_15]|nr:MAG: 4-hydroxy-tetrahydrodipicolinate reductase [Gammaproteobacteria bacterium RIFCSPHIGHO2_12_FULL_41_15]
MTISVAINGASGKMGTLASQALLQDKRFTLVGQLGKTDNLAEFIKANKPQVVVDFTRADTVYNNAKTIIDNNAHPVIGTSGLTEDQIQEFTQICAKKSLGGLIVPNFSLAVLLMMQFAKTAARFMESVEIVEIHHTQKLDAPSSTSIKTAREIASVREFSNPQPTSCDYGSRGQSRDQVVGAGRRHGQAAGSIVAGVPIHSLRLLGVIAKQDVIFGSPGETLTITHECTDRQSFMQGLLLACEKAPSLKSLKYGLEHIIEGLN